MQSLRHKIKSFWLRCVSDGVSANHDLVMAKRIRLYNYLRYASMALLATFALINLGFGVLRAAEVFAGAIAILFVSSVVFRLKYTNMAFHIAIGGIYFLIMGMTLLYGDTVYSYYHLFPLLAATVLLYNLNQKNALRTATVMIGGMAVAIAFGHLVIEPKVYPVPARLSQISDFILSTFLTAMAFVWLKVENDRIERALRDDHKWLKKLNQELTEAQQVLEKRAEQMIHHSKMTALGEMGSGMAHEINNPLTVAMGNLQLIIAEAGKEAPSNERVIKYATMALEYNKRIQTIVRALRHYSSDWEDSPLEDTDLQLIIQETSSLIGTRFRESGTDLLVSIGTNPIMINCRGAQISQAIMALLFNSYEATKSLPDRWINLLVEESETEVKINVIDSGTGIPKSVQDKLMQPFFTTKDVGQGKGLGLSTARAIIAQHKGNIHYDPASPNTCFVVTLPKAVANDANKAS